MLGRRPRGGMRGRPSKLHDAPAKGAPALSRENVQKISGEQESEVEEEETKASKSSQPELTL